jgi:hypothetical protein
MASKRKKGNKKRPAPFADCGRAGENARKRQKAEEDALVDGESTVVRTLYSALSRKLGNKRRAEALRRISQRVNLVTDLHSKAAAALKQHVHGVLFRPAYSTTDVPLSNAARIAAVMAPAEWPSLDRLINQTQYKNQFMWGQLSLAQQKAAKADMKEIDRMLELSALQFTTNFKTMIVQKKLFRQRVRTLIKVGGDMLSRLLHAYLH